MANKEKETPKEEIFGPPFVDPEVRGVRRRRLTMAEYLGDDRVVTINGFARPKPGLDLGPPGTIGHQ